jgi:hypothetical protein
MRQQRADSVPTVEAGESNTTMTNPGDKNPDKWWEPLVGIAIMLAVGWWCYKTFFPTAAEIQAQQRADQRWRDEQLNLPPPAGSWVPGSPDIINERVQ